MKAVICLLFDKLETVKHTIMKNRFVRGFLGVVIFLAVCAAASAVVMLLWNWIVPAVIGWGVLTFWQALGLILLCKLLFGGMGKMGAFGCFHGMHHGMHPGHRHFTCEERDRIRDEVKNMSCRERKEYIRKHMFGGFPGPGPAAPWAPSETKDNDRE